MTSPHRMAAGDVRTRTALMLAMLTALAWVVVTMMGRATGPYAAADLPDLAGLPVLVPQIERLVPPRELIPDAGFPTAGSTPVPPSSSEGSP